VRNAEEQGIHLETLLTPLVSLPITYLGLPLRIGKMKNGDWNILFEKIVAKLECWSTRYLSKGGRLILLNSVITSMPMFYFSIFKAPKSMWKRLDYEEKILLEGC
jgi:hypothetical protein